MTTGELNISLLEYPFLPLFPPKGRCGRCKKILLQHVKGMGEGKEVERDTRKLGEMLHRQTQVSLVHGTGHACSLRPWWEMACWGVEHRHSPIA